MKIRSEKLRKLKTLFWEYRWRSVKENLNSPVVMTRVLEMANPEQFRIFSSLVGDEEIIKFLKTRGERMLSKRSYNFWRLYYEKKAKKNS